MTFDPHKTVTVQRNGQHMTLCIRQWAEALAEALTTEDLAVFTVELEHAAGVDWSGG